MSEIDAGEGPVGLTETPDKAAAASRVAMLNWLDLTCRALPGVATSIVVLADPGQPQAFTLSAAWPSVALGLSLVAFSERCLGSGKALVESREGLITAGMPLFDRGQLAGALVIQVSASALSEGELRARIAAASAYLGRVLLRFGGDAATPEQQHLALQSALLRQICRPEAFPKSAVEVVNWLAHQFGCARVALGMVRGWTIRVHSLSHSAWFDRRARDIAAIENAMDEALNQRCTVVLPALPQRGAVIAIAHRDAAANSAVCSVILTGGDGLGAGVLFLERGIDRPFAADEVELLEDLAQLVGPVLETRERAHRWIGGRGYAAWRSFSSRLRDPRRPALRVGMAAGALLLAGLLFVDTTWRVGAEATIEGEQQRVIPAPFEGFIDSAPVKAGMVVRKDQLLAALDTRQVRLDLERWSAEEAQHRSQYYDAMSKHDQVAAAVSAAQASAAQAQRRLAEDKLAHAAMRAPYDAIVVSGDLTQQIGGPVEQGKVLFELAPLDAYRVIVKVEDRDIRAVKVGQHGYLVLAGLTDDKLGFVVNNVSVPEAKDGKNAFRVEARLEQAGRTLRPGMQGVAKIDVGQRNVLWVWMHTAWQWLALQLWKWLP